MGENPRTTKSAQESFIVVARCMGGEGMKEEVKQKKKNSSIQFSRGSRDPRRSSPLPLSHSPLALLHGSFSHDHPSPSLSHSHQRPRRSTASSLQFLFFFFVSVVCSCFFFSFCTTFFFLTALCSVCGSLVAASSPTLLLHCERGRARWQVSVCPAQWW